MVLRRRNPFSPGSKVEPGLKGRTKASLSSSVFLVNQTTSKGFFNLGLSPSSFPQTKACGRILSSKMFYAIFRFGIAVSNALFLCCFVVQF
jgi:hypothetical protein